MSSTSKYAVGLGARPQWRASCLMISLLAIAAILAGQAVSIQEFSTNSPTSITRGPDGALWFTAYRSGIGRITTAGVIQYFQLPDPNQTPGWITLGPDGALWFTETAFTGSSPFRIGRITTTGAFTEYSLPETSNPRYITAGPDGALWFTTFGETIGRITISGDLTEFPVSARSAGITTGPDGALWFAQQGRIGRITVGGAISYFPLPTGQNDCPEGITVGPDGALWFTDWCNGGVGRMTTSGVVAEYSTTASWAAGGITAGPDGALWFTEYIANKIGRITTGGVLTEYPLPNSFPVSGSWGITLGPDGGLWFAEQGASRIGHVVIGDVTPPVITPQVTGTLGSNGWYRSNVTVNWNVTDPDSGISSSTGCGTTTLSADTPGVTLTCSATNGAGLSASKAITIKIDQTPPVISGMPGPGCSIWPPNHKMVQVATVTAADATSGISAGSFKVTGTSNEPPSGPQISIVQSAGAYSVVLLAERSGDGTGRVYTIKAVANDQAGNTTTAAAICTVPHDRGN